MYYSSRSFQEFDDTLPPRCLSVRPCQRQRFRFVRESGDADSRKSEPASHMVDFFRDRGFEPNVLVFDGVMIRNDPVKKVHPDAAGRMQPVYSRTCPFADQTRHQADATYPTSSSLSVISSSFLGL
jgi:hypothetical protein